MPPFYFLKKASFFAFLLFACFGSTVFAQNKPLEYDKAYSDKAQAVPTMERKTNAEKKLHTNIPQLKEEEAKNSLQISDEKIENPDQVMACSAAGPYILPATTTACIGSSTTLTGYIGSGSCGGGCGGQFIQWYSGPSAAGPWTAIGGATGGTYGATSTSGTVYYIFTFKCGAAGTTYTTVAVSITGSGGPANDDFANATAITVGSASLTNQPLQCSTLETSENVACAEGVATQSVWYQFTATSTTTYVYMVDVAGAYYTSSAVWNSSSLPTGSGNTNVYCNLVSCQNAAFGPNNTLYKLNTVVGNTYYVQVIYSSTDAATFNIQVTNTNPGGTITNQPTNTSTTPNAGCYINNSASNPSCATVAASCTSYTMTSGNGNMENMVEDGYYSFTTPALQSTNDANFQDCVTSTCGAGNVDWLIWQVYESTGTNCISSGNLDGNLQLGGVGCGSTYILHYLWEPVNCSYTSFAPFIDNYQSTSCVLPINLVGFTAKENAMGNVDLYWATETETNNDFFTLSRSTDGKLFTDIGVVKGAGNSANIINYTYTDETAAKLTESTLYYRLAQTDFNGNKTDFNIVDISLKRDFSVSVYPNPSTGDFNLDFTSGMGNVIIVDLTDATGEIISSKLYAGSGGLQHTKIEPSSSGVYFLTITINGQVIHKKIVKL